jgi:hypothetical protein
MTNKDKYPMYALAAVAGAAFAVWAGLPLTFLFLLICPVMMFFMMRGMGGMGGGQRTDDVPTGQDAAKRSDVMMLDGSHESIDQP